MADHIQEFHWVELREGSVYDSGKLADARKAWAMGQRAEHKGVAYHSAFFFTEDVRKHVEESAQKNDKKKPSLRGYRGKHWAPYMLFDIDNHDFRENPELGKAQADDVLRVLTERLGIDVENILITFSGNKGYHLYIPTSAFDPDPSEDFGRRLRHIVQHGIWPLLDSTIFPNVKEVDWQLYDAIRVYRAVNSKHEKGAKLWKVPLTLKIFHEKTFMEHRDLAFGPCRAFEFPDWKAAKQSTEMTALWAKSANWREDDRRDFNSGDRKVFDFSAIAGADPKNIPDRRLCAMKVAQIDVGHGNRNAGALMLISDFKSQGMTPDQALVLMRPWLALQKGTTKGDQYLADQIRYVYDGGHANWGCFHPLAVANCFKQCRLFPQADVSRASADEWKSMDVLWEALVERTKQPVLYEMPFGSLRKSVRLREKQSNLLIGVTGSGKTALSLAIMRHNSSRIEHMRSESPDLKAGIGMFSLEMPGEELAERDGQFVTGQDQGWVENLIRRQIAAEKGGARDPSFDDMVSVSVDNMRNVRFYDGSAVDINRMGDLMQAGKEKFGMNLFVIDFLDRIRSRGNSQYERIAPIVIQLKDIDRQLGVQSLLLVQVARSTGEKGGLGLHSGRGSGQIEENADNIFIYEALSVEKLQQLGLPRKDGCRYMNIFTPKVRGGDPSGAAVVEFYGARMDFVDLDISPDQRNILRQEAAT